MERDYCSLNCGNCYRAPVNAPEARFFTCTRCRAPGFECNPRRRCCSGAKEQVQPSRELPAARSSEVGVTGPRPQLALRWYALGRQIIRPHAQTCDIGGSRRSSLA
jgi:hypothetical protein